MKRVKNNLTRTPLAWYNLFQVSLFHITHYFYDHALTPVPDEAFRGPEAQLFGGPYLFNKNQCRMVSP